MMSRRITLTIAAAILAVVLVGVIVFAATADEPNASSAATPDTVQDDPSGDDISTTDTSGEAPDTDDLTPEEVEAVSEYTLSLGR